MTSVVLSFSQQANQMTTHFNNTQNSRFLQSPQNRLPLRHISIKSIDRKTISNMYPRSVLFDYANGTGHLDPFIYFEDRPEIPGVIPVETSAKIVKDETTPKFWSDFSTVSYKPDCLLAHPRYNYDPGTGTGVSKSGGLEFGAGSGSGAGAGSFVKYEEGVAAWEQVDAFHSASDEVVRKLFEDADTVSNMYAVVALDTAWTGVCVETVRSVIDDQFNGHGSYVNVWSIENTGDVLNLDKIRKVVALADLNPAGVFQLNNRIPGSIYERTKKYAVPFDYVANADNVDELVYKLTNGSRKFINCVSSRDGELGVGTTGNGHIFSSIDVKSPDGDDDKVTLSVTNAPKIEFKKMYDFVAKYCRSDEGDEMKETLATLREEYVHGYDSDSDYDDY